MNGLVMYSEYRPQPSTLVLLNAYSDRAVDTPRSTSDANCNSWPGRASCAVSVHVEATYVKSSICFVSADPGAAGTFSGSTNSPCWPVLLSSGGGSMCGAGCCAVS